MKTTVELPDMLLRKAKSTAADRGQTLKQFLTEALQEKLAADRAPPGTEPPWMRSFGALAGLRKETRSIQARIDEAFGSVEPEDRQ